MRDQISDVFIRNIELIRRGQVKAKQDKSLNLTMQGNNHLTIKSLRNPMQNQHELVISEKSIRTVNPDRVGDDTKPIMKLLDYS